MPFETAITIRQAVQNVLEGRYLLPSIQRQFIWETDQIEVLFDSILRDYPIGSFLFWQVPERQSGDWRFYRFLTNYHEANDYLNEPAQMAANRDVTAVLDGQQRLTSLVLGLVGTYASKLPNKRRSNLSAYPVRKLYIDLMRPADETEPDRTYALRFMTPEKAAEDTDRHWVSFPELFAKVKDVPDVLGYMATSTISSAPQEERQFAARTLGRICQCLNTSPSINYFLERDANLDKVLQIFIRVNSGGTKLSYSDLLLSIATASWKGVNAREEIHGLVAMLNSFGDEMTFTKDFVLKSCLVLADLADIKFKVDNFNAVNMDRILEHWPGIKDALCLTVQLVRSFGLNDRSLLSNNALVPIAYYLHRRGARANYLTSNATMADRNAIRRWLATVLLRGTFGSMADTILAAIRGVIAAQPLDAFPIAEIATRLAELNRSVRFTNDELENLIALGYGDRRTFLVLSLLYPDLDYGHPFHVDHAYPRSKVTERRLLSAGLSEEEARTAAEGRDTLPNLQLLQGGPNQAKSDADFEDWLSTQCSTPSTRGYFLATHHFPDMPAFTYAAFPAFLAERREIMLERLREVLG